MRQMRLEGGFQVGTVRVILTYVERERERERELLTLNTLYYYYPPFYAQGRTNKLVDGCYAFWVGGTIVLLEHVLRGRVCLETRQNGLSLDMRPVSGGGGTPDDRQVDKAAVMEGDGLSVDPNSGSLCCDASDAQVGN